MFPTLPSIGMVIITQKTFNKLFVLITPGILMSLLSHYSCLPCWHVLKKIAFWGVWRMVLPSEFITITFTSNAATPSCFPRHGKPTWTTERKREKVWENLWFQFYRNLGKRHKEQSKTVHIFMTFLYPYWNRDYNFDHLGILHRTCAPCWVEKGWMTLINLYSLKTELGIFCWQSELVLSLKKQKIFSGN